MFAKKTKIALNYLIKSVEDFWGHFLTFNIFDIFVSEVDFFQNICFESLLLMFFQETPFVTIF